MKSEPNCGIFGTFKQKFKCQHNQRSTRLRHLFTSGQESFPQNVMTALSLFHRYYLHLNRNNGLLLVPFVSLERRNPRSALIVRKLIEKNYETVLTSAARHSFSSLLRLLLHTQQATGSRLPQKRRPLGGVEVARCFIYRGKRRDQLLKLPVRLECERKGRSKKK